MVSSSTNLTQFTNSVIFSCLLSLIFTQSELQLQNKRFPIIMTDSFRTPKLYSTKLHLCKTYEYKEPHNLKEEFDNHKCLINIISYMA